MTFYLSTNGGKMVSFKSSCSFYCSADFCYYSLLFCCLFSFIYGFFHLRVALVIVNYFLQVGPLQIGRCTVGVDRRDFFYLRAHTEL
jgi:hypothetical protein